MTGSSSNNVHSKISLKGSRMKESSSNNVHSKISLKGSRMTGSSSNNVLSKISLKGSRMTGSSSNNVHSKISSWEGIKGPQSNLEQALYRQFPSGRVLHRNKEKYICVCACIFWTHHTSLNSLNKSKLDQDSCKHFSLATKSEQKWIESLRVSLNNCPDVCSHHATGFSSE